jgi:urease accessory protein
MTLRATSFVRANFLMETPWGIIVLESSERHLRRRLITLQYGDEVLVDLDKATRFDDRDCLVLEDGRLVQIMAADEDLLEVTARDAMHLLQLAWHIGNRHLKAQIETNRILIRRDHVIAHMLQHQGASVQEVREPFSPENGAYHGHDHSSHGHEH